MINTKQLLICSAAALMLNACSDSSDYDFEKSIKETEDAAANQPVTKFEATFNPAASAVPFPTNLFFTGTEDGTLNIPVADVNNLADPKVALNALDGFSTNAPISTNFSMKVDPATVVLGDTVRIFEVGVTAQGATTSVVKELGLQEIFVTVQEQLLILLPLQPLKEQTTYMVVLTNGIKDTSGDAADKSLAYYLISGSTELTQGTAAQLEPLRKLTNTFEAAAESQGIDKANIVLSWTFSTQATTTVLQKISETSKPGKVVVAPTGVSTNVFIPALPGLANIHFGSIELPYFQSAPSVNDPSQALAGFWHDANGGLVTRYSPQPAASSTQTVPLLVSLPKTDAPENGYPVVIYQHGITSDRSTMILLADTMASAGIAVVAIDMPMHGITDTESPLYQGAKAVGATERTFDLDLANNESRAAGSDGIIDASGTHFYNLSNLLNARDNLRQAIVDLFVLRKSVAGIDIGGQKLDATNINFIGHSLGGIVGTVFLAFDEEVKAGSLAMPGSGIVRLLANSPSFGPVINAGLTAQGAAPGTAAYEAFLTAAQTVIDGGDPINFATQAGTNHPIHLIEVVGDDADNKSDQVIPNNVATAPLSGTDPLIRLLGLDVLSETTGNGTAEVSGAVRFTNGDHGSVLRPAANTEAQLNVTVEMQTQIVNFMATGGKLIKITDTSVIKDN